MSHRTDFLRAFSIAMTVVSVGTIAVIGGYLAWHGLPTLLRGGLTILTDADWAYRQQSFGAAAMIAGTAVVASIALLIAVPFGVGSALFISEIAGRRTRLLLKSLVELLAGVPSVVYGLLGIALLRPWIAELAAISGVELVQGDTLLTGGILLAVMILPTVTTFSEDAMAAIPRRNREAARGLGLTRGETILTVVIPAASPGIVAAILLALGRAAGETIAVFLVIGRADNRLPDSFGALLQPGQTLTSKLGGSEINISLGDPVHTSALLTLALLLFAGVIILSLTAERIRRAMVRRAN